MKRREFLVAAGATGALTGCVNISRQDRPRSLQSQDARVAPLLTAMTLAEKIGQMTQGELGNIRDESDVERLALGSVLSGGDADPAEGNSLTAWTDTVDRLIARSQRTRLKIPILYGVDAVHGHNNVEGAVVFPHNIALGCTRNAALVEEAARITALETRATGIHWTFAPCVAVPQDIRWGRTYEGFAEDPALCGELGAAAVRGLQTTDLGATDAVLACAKHYVGDGGTRFRPRAADAPAPGAGPRQPLLDQGDTVVDEATLRRLHLAPYIDAIAAGTGTVMASYSSWNGRKVTGHAELMTTVLKQQLGFEGFIVSDYNAISQVDRDWKTAIQMSINAGIDMAMEPGRYAAFIGNLTALVEEGRVPVSRIDDAVTRILRVKAAMGLLDAGRPQLADRRLHARFGSPAHRAVARRAVRESLVILKNTGVLPLARTARRLVLVGRGADDVGMQCGGWTIRWQGRLGPMAGGTSLRVALRKALPDAVALTHSLDGTDIAAADAAIVVVGESPYAEGVGDRAEVTLSAEDQAVVARVTATGVPTVLMVYSGRPLVLGPALDACAAVVAAWLPGSEGDGLADVLLGKYRPTGKLGFGWPGSMAAVPRGAAQPLFPYGHGLTW